MGHLAVGDVVSIPFPFSDRSSAKQRPALVVAQAEHDDVILCQITSRDYASRSAIPLQPSDFYSGGLPVASFVRPTKLFTASEAIATSTLGSLVVSRLRDIHQSITALFRSNAEVLDEAREKIGDTGISSDKIVSWIRKDRRSH